MARVLAMAALGCVAVLGLGGCGGGGEPLDRAAYEQQVREINQESFEQLDELSDGARLPDQATLEGIRTSLRDTADELNRITPPEEVAEAHAQWVAGLRDAANTIRSIEDDLTSEDRTVQLKAYQQLGEGSASRQLEAARAAFIEAGYDIFAAP